MRLSCFTHAASLVVLGVFGFNAPSDEQTDVPSPSAMQEMFDLSARRTKLELELRYVQKRLTQLEREQLSEFERVAEPVGVEYWESVSDDVPSAKAARDITAGQLLLYHAPGIYRVKSVRPKLTTKGECWYFKPDRDIRAGEEFSIVRVYDAPEELKLEAEGLFPGTDRARDPARAYMTEIHVAGRPRER